MNPDIFLSDDVKSVSRHNVEGEQSHYLALRRMLWRHFCVEEPWVLEWIRIPSDTCGRGNFCIRKEKVADSKISRYVWTGPQSVGLTLLIPHHIIASSVIKNSWIIDGHFVSTMILYNVFINLKVDKHNLTTTFAIPIPADGICIRELKTECTQFSLVFYGCVQRSCCQAKQIQQVNEPIDNKKTFDFCSIFHHSGLYRAWHICSHCLNELSHCRLSYFGHVQNYLPANWRKPGWK